MQGRFDIPGAITSVTGMGSLVYGFINASEHGWSNGVTIGVFAAAVVLLAAFVFIESRVEFPVFPLRLLRDSTRARSYGSYVLLVGAMFSMFFFLPQFMQEVLAYSPMQRGPGVPAADRDAVRGLALHPEAAAPVRPASADRHRHGADRRGAVLAVADLDPHRLRHRTCWCRS